VAARLRSRGSWYSTAVQLSPSCVTPSLRPASTTPVQPHPIHTVANTDRTNPRGSPDVDSSCPPALPLRLGCQRLPAAGLHGPSSPPSLRVAGCVRQLTDFVSTPAPRLPLWRGPLSSCNHDDAPPALPLSPGCQRLPAAGPPSCRTRSALDAAEVASGAYSGAYMEYTESGTGPLTHHYRSHTTHAPLPLTHHSCTTTAHTPLMHHPHMTHAPLMPQARPKHAPTTHQPRTKHAPSQSRTKPSTHQANHAPSTHQARTNHAPITR
jgi:hypothetical protein